MDERFYKCFLLSILLAWILRFPFFSRSLFFSPFFMKIVYRKNSLNITFLHIFCITKQLSIEQGIKETISYSYCVRFLLHILGAENIVEIRLRKILLTGIFNSMIIMEYLGTIRFSSFAYWKLQSIFIINENRRSLNSTHFQIDAIFYM